MQFEKSKFDISKSQSWDNENYGLQNGLVNRYFYFSSVCFSHELVKDLFSYSQTSKWDNENYALQNAYFLYAVADDVELQFEKSKFDI